MTTPLQDVLSEARKNKLSNIWNVLSDSDVVSMWDNVSAFVRKNMAQQKAVAVPGFGTFSFTQVKLDVGNNKFVLSQRPIFVLSEKLVQTHGLRQKKYLIPGGIPVVPLNLAHLATESNGRFDRDSIDLCIREVVGALSRCIASTRPVEFTFNTIGKLTVRDSRVKMKVFKGFLQIWDGSGKLVESLRDRPTTADSVMSEMVSGRDRSASALALPRDICGREPGKDPARTVLPAINEDAEEMETSRMEGTDEKADVLVVTDGECQPMEHDGDGAESKAFDDEKTDKSNAAAPASAAGRTAMTVPQVTAVSLLDDLIIGPSSPGRVHPVTPPAARSAASPSTARLPCPLPQDGARSPPTLRRSKTSVNGGALELPRPVLSGRYPVIGRSLSFDGASDRRSPPSTASSTSTCGHSNAGQELCYLCHQRAKRNVYVSFDEERRRREAEQDQLLSDFLRQRDAADMQREQEALLLKRRETQKAAEYNQSVAAENAANRTVKDQDFSPSFVLRNRAVTPPQFLKQERYQKSLEEQISLKDEAERQKKMDEEFLGRLEQVQLAQDIAAQREQLLKQKSDKTESYKRALSTQIELKAKRDALEAAAEAGSLPKEPYFASDYAARDESTLEKRRRANELFREQVALVEQRKREAILKRLDQQRSEEDMLSRNKREMLLDAVDRYERQCGNRRSLELEWLRAADAKRARDAEDRRLRLDPGTMVVHEQCDRYRRCGQCRRRLDNRGKTNIWCETRYVPGSRIMV